MVNISGNAVPGFYNLCNCFQKLHLRIYPPRFAIRIAQYHARFCRKCQAFPPGADDLDMDAKEILELSPWDEDDDRWDDAGLTAVFFYLRGSKGLDLGDMREAFPETL